ncbi:MAG: hypothetical protein WBP53_08950, partial [Dokdonella sp.]
MSRDVCRIARIAHSHDDPSESIKLLIRNWRAAKLIREFSLYPGCRHCPTEALTDFSEQASGRMRRSRSRTNGNPASVWPSMSLLQCKWLICMVAMGGL